MILPPEYDVQAVSVPWYTPETWRELCALPEAEIEISYEQYLDKHRRMVAELVRDGMRVVEAPIDIKQMVEWCHKHGYTANGNGRAVFGSALLCAQEHGEDVMTVPFEDRTRGLP
jgi:hypothetical protein